MNYCFLKKCMEYSKILVIMLPLSHSHHKNQNIVSAKQQILDKNYYILIVLYLRYWSIDFIIGHWPLQAPDTSSLSQSILIVQVGMMFYTYNDNAYQFILFHWETREFSDQGDLKKIYLLYKRALNKSSGTVRYL